MVSVSGTTLQKPRTSSKNCAISSQPILSLRTQTCVTSLSTCTLMTGPAFKRLSALSALAESSDSRYNTTLLSIKCLNLVTRIGLVPAEAEVRRQFAPEGAQALQ